MTKQLQTALKRTTITLIVATFGIGLFATGVWAGSAEGGSEPSTVQARGSFWNFDPQTGSRGATARATGTLELHGTLQLVSNQNECPVPTTTAGVCAARTGKGLISGLGGVSEAYAFLADIDAAPCGLGRGRALAYPVTLVVAGKGEVQVALAEASTCAANEAVRVQSQSFTVTGGTGIYAGATGRGTVDRTLGGLTAVGRVGTETWRGTLVASGVDFDVTPPSLSGAGSKTVRVPPGTRTAPVRFTVTAKDAVDGTVPVVCKPRSGSRFKLGTARVTCAATDTSGNTAAARFNVTVRTRA